MREQMLAAAKELLAQSENAAGLTLEVLTLQLRQTLRQPIQAERLITLLRSQPNRFVEGKDGRWRLKEAGAGLLTPDDEAAPGSPTAEQGRAPELATQPGRPRPPQPLTPGAFVVFDLEATGRDPLAPSTHIIQIAAQRYENWQPVAAFDTFVRLSSELPAEISRLTGIRPEDLSSPAARPLSDALPSFFAFCGGAPLIAHNGAHYDGPLLIASCQRAGIAPLPQLNYVLDTLPLARTLLPGLERHRVEALAKHFEVLQAGAHRADVDVAMLCGIVLGLRHTLHNTISGRAAGALLARAQEAWVELMGASPAGEPALAEIVGELGANIRALLAERTTALDPSGLGAAATEAVFDRMAQAGKPRREPQITMARLAAETLQSSAGNFAVIEAGTGTGKSLGYLIPAALTAKATGQPVAVSTFTRILQSQLMSTETEAVQKLLPGVTYSQLQGRANYLSLSRLAEELEDALAESRLPAGRAWLLALLTAWAAHSADGNLEEIATSLRSLDEFLATGGALYQMLSGLRASEDDSPSAGSDSPDFYRRARANAERADLVIVNHALLLNSFLAAKTPDDLLATRLVCDEAHNLEEAATLALENRADEHVLVRLLKAIYHAENRSGLLPEVRRRLSLPATEPALQEAAGLVAESLAALDSWGQQLYNYARNQTVIATADLERYGVRVPIEDGALQAAGGPALRTAYETLGANLRQLDQNLEGLVERLKQAWQTGLSGGGQPSRLRRLFRLASSLRRDLRDWHSQYSWFWTFNEPNRFVRIVELAALTSGTNPANSRPSVAISGVPINVGPELWETVWSRLEAGVFASATLKVFGQGFNFFLGRVGLEATRLQSAEPPRTLTTCELPPAFDYPANALLMLPNDLPAPRDSDLKRNFPEAVAGLLERFIPFFGGRTLVLFTANARRDMVYERLNTKLTEKGFPLLAQGQGSLPQLLDEFRADEATSLLGSRSLWEGVNVPGPSLSHVFLEKLPYASLGDPVESARMNAITDSGGNAFYDYLLPKMIITLKQGFGRLIRQHGDKGSVTLLDKRLRNSLYRQEVLRSLPDPTVGYESDVDYFRRIAEWLDISFDPAELPPPAQPDLVQILAAQELATPFVSEADFDQVALPRLLAVQQAVWGQSGFREGQLEIIRNVLSGKNVLTLLPTGAGKSRTFQLPALIRPGLTLVISPLIALIRDQVEKLREIPGMTWAAALVSGMDAGSQEEVLRNAVARRLKLLYISPERLRDPRFRAFLPQLPLVQLVIDEAHCISTWGHDFRPDFLEIGRLLPNSTALPVHALTATATSQVQTEIVSRLGMAATSREFVTYTGNFGRTNLVFRCYAVRRQDERDQLAISLAHQIVRNEERGGAGIIYVATVKAAEQLARLLRNRNIAAQAYHGKLPHAERNQIQEQFMQGELEVVVATNAFGMGVDKAEIRFVLHYDHPTSLEAYAQEAGRAGRDGKEAYAILLYHSQSARTGRFIARQNLPTRDRLQAFRQTLLDLQAELPTLPDGMVLCDIESLAGQRTEDQTLARVLLFSFEEAGMLERGSDCTLEASFLLNKQPAEVLATLSDPTERSLLQQLFTFTSAAKDVTVRYQALAFYAATSHDPRQLDALLNRLAGQDLLIYRAFSRGLSLRLTSSLADEATLLTTTLARFTNRYQQFEERLQAMLDFISLRAGQNHCRNAYLTDYLSGAALGTSAPCGKCDLCSPAGLDLPWDPATRLYGQPLALNVGMELLRAVATHDNIFGRWTIQKMLLGVPQTSSNGQVHHLAVSARNSSWFGALQDAGVAEERLQRILDVLVETGFLALSERELPNREKYSAVCITPKGRDALAGGVGLPAYPEE